MEYWIKVKGHPRYMVSTLGRVKCLDWKRTGKEKICKLSVDSHGYLQVSIDGVLKKVHRLVAEAFIPNPEWKPCIDHINTVKTDNFVILADDGQTILYSNLRWVSHKENSSNPLTRKHMSENAPKPMLGKFGDEHSHSVSIVQLTKDGLFVKKWPAAREVQRELGINSSHITQCCKGKLKTTGGFKWVYADKYVPRTKSISDIKHLF